MLIDSGHTANSSNRGIRGAHLQQGCGIQMVLKFVVAIAKPLRYIIAISYHSFYMKIQCVAHLFIQFIVRFCSNNHCTRYILAQNCTKILVTPRYIHNNFFHIHITLYAFIFVLHFGAKVIKRIPFCK